MSQSTDLEFEETPEIELTFQAFVSAQSGDTLLQRYAGEDISALRVVYELNNQVFYLDPEDEMHIELLLGVTFTSAQAQQLLSVQPGGVMDDSGWSWVPGPIWLGSNGTITQSPPATGYDVRIGAAVSPTRITLNLQDPIELE
jgi:hypothetical protein